MYFAKFKPFIEIWKVLDTTSKYIFKKIVNLKKKKKIGLTFGLE